MNKYQHLDMNSRFARYGYNLNSLFFLLMIVLILIYIYIYLFRWHHFELYSNNNDMKSTQM